MKVSDLTESETKVWEAAATGTLVDLRVGNPELDIGDGEAASIPVRGVRL